MTDNSDKNAAFGKFGKQAASSGANSIHAADY
jgi:hypothetical protein